MYFIPQLVEASAPVQNLAKELEKALAKGGYEYQPADRVRSRLAAKHNLHMLHEKLDQTRESQFQAYRGALSDPRVLEVWRRLDYRTSETQKKVVLEDAILLSLGRRLRDDSRGIENSPKECSPQKSLPKATKHRSKDIPTMEAQNFIHRLAFPKSAAENAGDGLSHGNLAANVELGTKYCYLWPPKDWHEARKTSSNPNENDTIFVKYPLSPSGTVLHLPRQRFPTSQSGLRRIFCRTPISEPPSSDFMLIMSDGKLPELETISLTKAATAVGWIKSAGDGRLRKMLEELGVEGEEVVEEKVEETKQDTKLDNKQETKQETKQGDVDLESVEQVTPHNPKIRKPAYGRAKQRASKGALLRFSGEGKPLSKNSTNFRTHVARNSNPKW